jgi:glycosyltransferase involved in cell wall biosynthesis
MKVEPVVEGTASRPSVHVAQNMYSLGGLETLVLDLMRKDNKAMCFSLEGSTAQLGRQLHLAQFTGRVIGMNKGPGFDWQLIDHLRRMFLHLRPRSVIAHHIGPLLYAGSACRLARIPVLIYYEHDTWHYRQGNDRFLAQLLSRVLKPKCLAVSHAAAEDMKPIFGKRGIRVLPPGIDLKRFTIRERSHARRRLNLPLDGVQIGSVGRLAEVKGHKFLVEAVATLPPNHRLVLLGAGPEQAPLQAQAREVGIADRVTFLGHRNDVEEVLPAFDLVCLPSLAEGLPRALIEAQACGIPVVATDVGGVVKAVNPDAGEVVPSNDVAALVAAMQRLLARRHHPEELRRWVADRFSLETVVEVLDDLAGAEKTTRAR